jgi:hypothetical protein
MATALQSFRCNGSLRPSTLISVALANGGSARLAHKNNSLSRPGSIQAENALTSFCRCVSRQNLPSHANAASCPRHFFFPHLGEPFRAPRPSPPAGLVRALATVLLFGLSRGRNSAFRRRDKAGSANASQETPSAAARTWTVLQFGSHSPRSGRRRGHVGLAAQAQDNAVNGVDNQGPGQ